MGTPSSAAGIPGQLGGFTVLSVLGEGGSSTVYAVDFGGRRLALKVLRAETVPTVRQRKQFLAEAQTLAGIEHPGIVRVVGFGELEDGRPYLLMELLEGESLAQRLWRGPLPFAEALALFGRLAAALATLHERGLLHRDVKPENVFLGAGERGIVLFDFGIAKETDAPASTLTQDGAVRGTPAYMAPERFFGAPASTQSEVYELGVVLYAMLTGRLPWPQTPDPEARLNPARPSEHGFPLPPLLEIELLRALSTRAESRPPTVRDFAVRVNAAAAVGSDAGPRRTTDLPGPTPAAVLAHAPTVLQATPPYTPPAGMTPSAGGAAPPGPAAQYTTTATTPRRSILPWVGIVGGVAGIVSAVVVGLWVRDGGREVELEKPPAPDEEQRTDDDPAPVPDPRPTPGPRPRRDPLTARVPDEVWKAHPRDTSAVVGVAFAQLRESEAARELTAESISPELAMGMRLLESSCGFDPVADLEWVTFGVGEASTDDVDVVISGRWTRAALEKCIVAVAKLADTPATLAPDGALTRIDLGARTVWLGWLDDHTAMLSTRVAADRAWMTARLAGKDPASGSKRLVALRDGVDRARNLWLVADHPDWMEGPLLTGLPTPKAMLGSLQLDEDVDFEVTWSYAKPADAAAAAEKVRAELDKLKKDPFVGLLLTRATVDARGSDVVIALYLDAKATRVVMKGLGEALKSAMKDL